MAAWAFNSITIDSIGDIMEFADGSSMGFGWVKALVSLAGGPNGSFLNITIELPMGYHGNETIEAVRQRAYAQIIDGLRLAAGRLAERPAPPLDRPPPELPAA